MTVKQLIVHGFSGYPDFRSDLINLYLRNNKLMNVTGAELHSDYISFEKKYFKPEDCLIFMQNGAVWDWASYAIMCGYTVDSARIIEMMTSYKPALFKCLEEMNFPVPSFSSKKFLDVKYNFKVGANNNYLVTEASASTPDTYETTMYVPMGDDPFVEGHLLYFYLGEPIIQGRIVLENKGKFCYRESSINPFNVAKGFSDTSKVDVETLVKNIDPLSEVYIDQLKKVCRRLSLQAAEFLIADKRDGKKMILNIDPTHFPLSKDILPNLFLRYARKRFMDFMRIENEKLQ